METMHLAEQPLDYDDFANQLLEQGAEQSPSHLHGGVCGLLAGGALAEPDACLAGLARALDADLHGELAENCLRLAAVTIQVLEGDDFDFQLFLPDDEEELEARVRALADWCGAFLAGFALAVPAQEQGGLDEEVSEILRDVSAIAEAEHDADAEDEESEEHLFELGEYLRFATLNLYLDARERRQEAAER